MKNDICILIPGYNCEKYLDRCFNSILKQNNSKCQVIFVNDGSVDGTRQKALSYRKIFLDNGIDYCFVDCKQNNGQAAAINKGLPLVNSKYFMWLDSDDFLLPGCFDTYINFLDTHVNTELCISDAILCGGGHSKKICVQNKSEEYFFHVLDMSDVLWMPGSVCVRTNFLFSRISNKKIFESREGQNIQLLLPILYNSNYVFLNKTTYCVFEHYDSHSRMARTYEENFNRQLNFIKIFEATIKQTKAIEKRNKKLYIKRATKGLTIPLFYEACNRNDKQKIKKVYKVIKKSRLSNFSILKAKIMHTSRLLNLAKKLYFKTKSCIKKILKLIFPNYTKRGKIVRKIYHKFK